MRVRFPLVTPLVVSRLRAPVTQKKDTHEISSSWRDFWFLLTARPFCPILPFPLPRSRTAAAPLPGNPSRPECCFLPCGPRGHALLSLATPFGEYPFPTGSPFIGDRNHSAYMSDLRIHLCKEEAVAFSQHNIIGVKQASPSVSNKPLFTKFRCIQRPLTKC